MGACSGALRKPQDMLGKASGSYSPVVVMLVLLVSEASLKVSQAGLDGLCQAPCVLGSCGRSCGRYN